MDRIHQKPAGIEIITGDREAELTFLDSRIRFRGRRRIVDIGGGSTEVVSICDGRRSHSITGGGLWAVRSVLRVIHPARVERATRRKGFDLGTAERRR